jgi:iron complex outermembrane recepter protein
MHRISGRLHFASIAFQVAALFWWSGAQAQVLVHFDLPAQPLAKSLKAIGTATNTDIGFNSSQVARFTAPELKADLTVDGALLRVLAGTGLRARHLNDHAIVIATAEPPTSGASQTKRMPATVSASTEVGDQLTTPQGPTQSDATDQPSSTSTKKDLEEIVVTGTHIAGGPPIGSPLITVSDADIANSGYSTIGDVIRSLPQSYGGGINPGSSGSSVTNTNQNISYASSVNLHGLGSDSTLTLVDGHRFVYDGFTSTFDISAIPLAAIDHVEILTDSASSVYGSDAVSGVANFILKKNYDGAQTVARLGGASDGGATERQVSQLLGRTWTGGSALISYEFYDQDELFASQRSFSSSSPNPQTLLPEQKRDSVFANVHQDLSDVISVYAEGLYSNRSTNSVSNFGTGTVEYTDNTTTMAGASSGMTAHLNREWTASVDTTFSRSKDDQPYYSVTDGVPTPPIPDYFANEEASVETQASGPILNLSSGPVQAAVGAGYRREGYHDIVTSLVTRHIDYGFGELRIPLVRPDPSRIGLDKLEIAASGRYEKYSDFGVAATPKVGVLYAPLADVNVRGSWGRAFRAPDLQAEYAQRTVAVFPGALFGVTSPSDAQILYQNNANPTLRPETARSWTAGFDYKPSSAPPVRISLTYFNVDYRSRITEPLANPLAALSTPIDSPFVTLNPSAAAQAALVAGTNFANLSGVPYDPSNVVAFINNQYQNVVTQQAHGVDVTGDYRLQSALGDFDLLANASWLRLAEVLVPGSPTQTLTGTVFNPPKFRSRLGITWQRGSWSETTFVNYISAESDNTNPTPIAVASWATVDAQINFDATSWGRIFQGLRFIAAASNLFDRNPPTVSPTSTAIPGLGYDGTNASPLGRFISISAAKKW